MLSVVTYDIGFVEVPQFHSAAVTLEQSLRASHQLTHQPLNRRLLLEQVVNDLQQNL